MSRSDHFLPLFDSGGDLYAVMLSAELWQKSRHRLEGIINQTLDLLKPEIPVEPVHEWEELLGYWDFKYEPTLDVQCEHCRSSTEDWLHDPAKPFRLKSASLGGLVVFHCNQCGATVRKKHFKDHYCFECSPLS